jgi:MFS family permease
VKYFPEIDPLPFPNGSPEYSSRSTNQGIAVASYNLGCFLGAVFTVFIGNPLGRKKTIFMGSIVMVVGALLQCTSYSLPQLIVGRIVTGWGNGMNTSVSACIQEASNLLR